MTKLKPSPLAPASFPDLPPVPGVALGAVDADLAYGPRSDLMMAVMHEDTAAAGVFTRSRCPSAAVDWCRAAFQQTGGTETRALVVNAGNANAFTGSAGEVAARATAQKAAALAGCEPEQVMLASTGVIGEQLDTGPLASGLARLYPALAATGWRDGAEAIRTTDTFAKGCSKQALLDGDTVVINGIAKGSGMIAPDMATMLGFVFTNARIAAPVLQALLSEATALSYNSITVDSDTSTSDTVLAFATGQDVSHEMISDPADPRLADFREKFTALNRDLAQQIVRDGEGATKFVSVTIEGAEDDASARRIALSVANSPLVKTAIAGEDANWGRIVMAIGKAGEPANRDRISIWAGDTMIAEKGAAVPGYDEAPVNAHMKGQDICFRADVGVGSGQATVWTCDLTHGYISINGDYRS